MRTLKVFDLFERGVLITRSSARSLRDAVAPLVSAGEEGLALDLSGIEAVAPSFLDETIGGLAELADSVSRPAFQVRVLHPPTGLSPIFEAIARARGIQISESPDGSWTIVWPGDRVGRRAHPTSAQPAGVARPDPEGRRNED